MPMHWTEYKIR